MSAAGCWREVCAVVMLVAAADVTLYRGEGYAGYAALLLAAPLLLVLGSPRPRFHWNLWLVGAMLWLMALRIAWLGSPLTLVMGCGLLVAFAMLLAGRQPYLFGTLAYAVQTSVAGFVGFKLDPEKRTAAWDRFREYTYQWY